jgi:UDP-N-acetylmuramoylalanine--D-glutamate ligase
MRLPPTPLGADDLAGVDRILKSPGLAPHDAGIAALLAAARTAGVPVEGELDVFADALEGLRSSADYVPKVIAVTGTNGKTTTTALTALLVERSGRRVAVAGTSGRRCCRRSPTRSTRAPPRRSASGSPRSGCSSSRASSSTG